MKSSYSGFPEGLPIMLEPSGPNFAPHPIRVWGYYAKWQAKRRQESLDAVYAATYNCEAVDGRSETEDEAIPF